MYKMVYFNIKIRFTLNQLEDTNCLKVKTTKWKNLFIEVLNKRKKIKNPQNWNMLK